MTSTLAPIAPASHPSPEDWLEPLLERHFHFVPGAVVQDSLGASAMAAWPAFADSWNRLELDTYMADGGRYRRRRYATLVAEAGGPLHLQPHQPHYQSLDYNRLNGGIARHFAPIEPEVLAGATLPAALALGLRLFRGLYPSTACHVEVHQFRIEAMPGAEGRPTPEGAHRDGVDFVLVMMVRRQNIASGTTEICGLDATPIDSFTLTAPGDAALVHDPYALHGVTPIEPVDARSPAWRDVLVATYRRSG